MRRTVLLLASVALVALLASGVALAAIVNCEVGAFECVGTNNPDTLNGSADTDWMYGLSGDDTLYGNAGGDPIQGGKQDDTIRGGPGADFVAYGLEGDDKIYGGGGDDFLSDFSEHCVGTNDGQLRCVGHRNLLDGGEGNDQLEGNHKLYGGPGNDEIYGAYGRDGESRVIRGGSGTDVIDSVGSAVDTIYAQDGERDEIFCGGKTDTVYYDKGIDSVNLRNCEKLID